MYEQYWRLQRPAFRADTPAEFFYAGRTHQSALLKLQYLVEQRQGAALVCGAAGAGKTCLLEVFRQRLPAGAGPFVSVLFPQLTAPEFLAYLASKLGVEDASLDQSAQRLDWVLRLLEGRLQQLTRQDRHPVLVIDDAQLIEDQHVLQSLQLLLNFRQPDHLDFSLVLAGQPELVGQVRRLQPLQERLALTCGLQSLDGAETAAYIRQRLRAAGSAHEIFDDEALALIHELSGGLPRRINRLCDFALLVGYADNLKRISPAQVEAVAEELTTGVAA